MYLASIMSDIFLVWFSQAVLCISVWLLLLWLNNILSYGRTSLS